MAVLERVIYSRCDDPSLDPSGVLVVRIQYNEGNGNNISCYLRIDDGCGHDNMLYDYYLCVARQGSYPYAEVRESVVYSFDFGVQRVDNFTVASYSWVALLAPGDTITIYGTFAHHLTPSISCTFPTTQVSLP